MVCSEHAHARFLTDHNPLTCLPTELVLSRRQTRWSGNRFSHVTSIHAKLDLFTGSPDAPVLVSAGKDSVQSSTSGQLVAALAVDGNTSSIYGSCATTLSQGAQYWQVDLGDTYQIANVTVINRYCVFASTFTPVLASVSVSHVCAGK